MRAVEAGPRRTDLTFAGLAAVSSGVVYGLTLCPTVHWYDSAEFSASAATMRVAPHPPGYPLYTLIGHLFTYLPGEAALGMNIMSAVFGVVATILLYVCARQIGARPIAAFASAMLLGFAPSLWGNAVKAEVYTPGLAFTLGALALVLEARRRDSVVLTWAGAGLAGLGLGVHMSIATLGVGYVLLVASHWVQPGGGESRPKPRWKRFASTSLGCTIALALGASVLMGVPMGLFQEITPLGTGGHLPEVMWTRGMDYLSGGVFRGYFHRFPLWPRFVTIWDVYATNLTPVGVALGIAGLVVLARRSWIVAAALAAGIIGNAVWFFNYDVPDLDVFLLPGMASLIIAAAAGLEFIAERIDAKRDGWGARVVALALLMPASHLVLHWTAMDLSDDYAAADYGERFCKVIPDDAVLAMTSQPAEWQRYTVALYMHETRRGCGSVIFWGFARPWRIKKAFMNGHRVFTFTDKPRFAPSFKIEPRGPAFEVLRR